MDNYILRELNSGRFINYIDSRVHYANHIGNAIKFPTDDEANGYVRDNGLHWTEYGVERA